MNRDFKYIQVMYLVLVHILYVPLCSADMTISINLVPRDYICPRKEDGFICGLDKKIDKDRLLAEHNPSFILEYLDNSNDVTPLYRTSVFNVLGFSSAEEPIKLWEDHLSETDEPALYSLLMVPPRAQCSRMTFEDAKDIGGNYYPIFVGNADNLTAAIQTFISQARSLKNIYDDQLPKLCGTKQLMQEQVIQARATTLNSLFSFALNSESPRSIDVAGWKACKTSDESKTSIYNSNFFDTNPQVHFENKNEDGNEGDGFASVFLLKSSDKTRRTVLFVKTEPGNATEDDFVQYNGPVVFDINQERLEIIIQVKIDDVEDDNEFFKVGYELLTRPNGREKRAVPIVEETAVALQNQPRLSDYLKSINNCRWRVIKALTKEMAYWDTEEKKKNSLLLVNSEVIEIFKSFDPYNTNIIRMYRRAGKGYLVACNKARKLVPSKSGNELWFSTSLKHSRMFHNEGSDDNTDDIVFEILVNLDLFLATFDQKIVNNDNAGAIWNNHPKGKGQTKVPYPETHWKNLIHRENLNRDRPDPVGKQKKQVDHPWGKINFATVGKIHLENFQSCIESINICKMERLNDIKGKPMNEYKVKGCEQWEHKPMVNTNTDSDTDTRRSSQSKVDLNFPDNKQDVKKDGNKDGKKDDKKDDKTNIKKDVKKDDNKDGKKDVKKDDNKDGKKDIKKLK